MIDHSLRFRLANSLPPALGIRAELARAEVAQRQGLFLEAVQVLRRAASAWPGDHRVQANLGNALWLADRPAEALDPYQKATLLAPGDPVVCRGLANVYVDLGRFEAADRAYHRSLVLMADPATAWNHSQLLVGLERYAEGYALAESRWNLAGVTAYRGVEQRCTGVAQLERGHLRVWSEQGLGDTLQHLRWLGPLLQRRGDTPEPVVLELEPCLVPLVEQALLPSQPGLVVEAKDSSGAKAYEGLHVPLLGLPHWLGARPMPEHAAALSHPAWSGPNSHRTPRVGVVWAAGRKLDDPFQRREYLKRSLPAAALAQLVSGLRGAGIAPVNLQFGPDRELGMALNPTFSEAQPVDADFGATAAWVADLDLVISVDTAMAHLVGAMGRPGLVLLPWAAAPRWLRGSSRSPWYPSLRLFRQPRPGDWVTLMDTVVEAAAQACIALRG